MEVGELGVFITATVSLLSWPTGVLNPDEERRSRQTGRGTDTPYPCVSTSLCWERVNKVGSRSPGLLWVAGAGWWLSHLPSIPGPDVWPIMAELNLNKERRRRTPHRRKGVGWLRERPCAMSLDGTVCSVCVPSGLVVTCSQSVSSFGNAAVPRTGAGLRRTPSHGPGIGLERKPPPPFPPHQSWQAVIGDTGNRHLVQNSPEIVAL